jgi:6-phosphogluconolactonase
MPYRRSIFFASVSLLVACSSGGSEMNPPGSNTGGAGMAANSGGRSGAGGTTQSTGGASGSASGGAGGGAGGAPGAGGMGAPMPGSGGASPGDAAAAESGGGAEVAAPAPSGNPYVYVGATAEPRIRIFELDIATGALTPKGMAMANAAPNYLAVHPTRKFLYVTSQVSAGRVVAFAIDSAGMLTRLNDVPSGGADPAHISLHKSGKWLFVANYFGNNASALPVGDDGRLGEPVSTVPAGQEAHMAVDDGVTGNFVFVPSKGSNRVGQFRFDPATGKLEPNQPPTVAEAGAPRHIAFHRSGRFAYLLTEGSRTVVAYKYDSTAGLLSPLARVVAGNSGFASTIVFHPTKDNIFYAGVRGPDTITTFTVDEEGRPKSVGQVNDELSYPWDFALDATGKFLVAANNTSASIKVFRVNGDNGTLSLVGGAAVPAQVRTVRIVYPP